AHTTAPHERAAGVEAPRLRQHDRGRDDEIVQVLEPDCRRPEKRTATEAARRRPADVAAVIDPERLTEVAAWQRPEIDDAAARLPKRGPTRTNRVGRIAHDIATRVHANRLTCDVTRECAQIPRGAPRRPQNRAATDAGVRHADDVSPVIDPQRANGRTRNAGQRGDGAVCRPENGT